MEISNIKCSQCDLHLALKKTLFNYMGRTFNHEVPCCPKCGMVFIPKELAEGKMAKLEQQLEDK